MSVTGGPDIVEDGLVLALDAANIKSFRGEPTTNEFVNVGGSVRSTWRGDGVDQTSFTKGFDIITNPSLKYNNYDTVLWRSGVSLNCYLHSDNVNSSRTSTTWVFSCYIRREDGGTLRQSDNNLQVYLYFPTSDGSTTGTIENVGNGWYRVSRTRTGTSANITLAGFTGFAANFKYYLSGWILEKKTEPTKFWIPTDTTRGTTVTTGGGWNDRSGNTNHGELVNGPTFSSGNGGSLVFDAINDYVSIPSFTFTPYCLDFWLYNNNAVPNNDSAIGGPSTYQTLIHYPGGMISLGGWTGAATNEALHIWSFTGGNRLTYTQTSVPIGNHNWVFNWNGSHYDIWVDGQKQIVYASTNGHALLGSLTNAIKLGYDGGTYYFHGRIYSFKMYGSQLSDNQVLQNYNATKGRFGL